MFQSLNETISIKSKVIEDQTDSIRKLKQVSLLSEGFVECLKSKACAGTGNPKSIFSIDRSLDPKLLQQPGTGQSVLHYDSIRGSC